MSKRRICGLPLLLIPPSCCRPPLENSRGTRPIQAAKCRPDRNWAALVTEANERGSDRTDARYRREARTDLVGAMPGDQPIVEMVNPVIEIADLSASALSVLFRLTNGFTY
jgi:hypothetical protein